MFGSPFPITNPHLFPGTGYSTEVIPGMFAGGPLGGGPPRCLDCIHIKRTESYLTTGFLLRFVKGGNKFAITGGRHLVNRDFKHQRRERQRRREIARENPNVTLRMSGGKYLNVLLQGPI